ncbi:MAG: hypothetical protein ACRES4_05435 [Nevskiales bacterium]
MKPATLIGILLIVAGAGGLGYGSYSYTEEKTVFKIGELEATTQDEKSVPLKPIGLGLIGAGVLLVVFGGRRK